MADQSLPLRRYLSANLVALAPSGVALATLHWTGALAGRPALIAFLGIAVVTVILVQRYLVSLGRFARFVGELSGEREPVMPRLSFAPATEELATAAATLATGWRRQRAAIDNLAASAQAIVDGLPDPLPGTAFHQMVSSQLGPKENWADSDDLDILFQGAFTSDFYRALADALHLEVREGSAAAGTAWSHVLELKETCARQNAPKLPIWTSC